MRKATTIVSSVLVCAFLMSGCASTGLTASSHMTNVQLTEPNYRLVATNISGEGSAEALIGVSVGLGFGTSQLALVPLNKNRRLYSTAMQNLWENFESKNGPIANRKLALVNLRFDSDALNLFLYTRINTVIVADVVEFE